MLKMKRPARDGKAWSREDHAIAFNLYCQLPFGKLHHSNPRIIELARLLERTPDSLSMKLCNFASMDPSLASRGIKGLTGASRGVGSIWQEFRDAPEQLAYESERLLARRVGKPVEEFADIPESDLPIAGKEREALVQLRVNQNFFRRRILSAYDYRCCVTGLALPELLVASHIVPWSIDTANRLNPRNGLCLNPLHDRAFERGLMWIDDDFGIRFAERAECDGRSGDAALEWLTGFRGRTLCIPKDFAPDKPLLRRHRERAQSSRNTAMWQE